MESNDKGLGMLLWIFLGWHNSYSAHWYRTMLTKITQLSFKMSIQIEEHFQFYSYLSKGTYLYTCTHIFRHTLTHKNTHADTHRKIHFPLSTSSLINSEFHGCSQTKLPFSQPWPLYWVKHDGWCHYCESPLGKTISHVKEHLWSTQKWRDQ